MSKFTSFRTSSALLQNDADVIEQFDKKSALIRSLNATGGDAADTIRFFPGGLKGETTVLTAISASDDAGFFVGDTGVKNTINGNVIAANDFILLHLDTGGFQLMEIIAVNAGVADDQIEVTDFTAFSGDNAPRAASAVGSTAYFILAEDVSTIGIGTSSLNLDLPFLGEGGHPCAISSDGAAAAQQNVAGVVEYVDGGITRI